MSPPTILFAPVLRSERWTSIDLQQQNILDALRALPDPPRIEIAEPSEALVRLPGGRPFARDFLYPARLRRAASRLGHCVLHVTDHSYGHLCHAHEPSVANCNDVHHFVQPDLPPTQLARWKKRVLGLHAASRVLAVSAHLGREICEHLALPADRIAVLPGGVDHATFRPLPEIEAAVLLPALAALRTENLLVLNIGSNIRRKNLPTLLRAVRLLREERRLPVRLVKVGDPLHGSEYAPLLRELDLEAAVIDAGRLTPPQVAAACRLAHVLSFPTLYEGFGRPTLEAQACALPCVLSDASCLREIGGEGALYHAPTNPEALADALARVLTDGRVRTGLITAGLANAARFTWSRYAESLVQVYAEAAR